MPKLKFKIEDRDRGFKALLKRLIKRKSPRVRVGIYGTKGNARYKGTGATVAEVAAVHEFGAPSKNIPKRSFLRDTATIHEKQIRRNMALTTERVITGVESERTALLKFGEWFVGVVKKRIAAGIPPALKAETIRRKGSSKPLIDTGQLRNSITAEVE
jgi:phage gpG-like protein